MGGTPRAVTNRLWGDAARPRPPGVRRVKPRLSRRSRLSRTARHSAAWPAPEPVRRTARPLRRLRRHSGSAGCLRESRQPPPSALGAGTRDVGRRLPANDSPGCAAAHAPSSPASQPNRCVLPASRPFYLHPSSALVRAARAARRAVRGPALLPPPWTPKRNRTLPGPVPRLGRTSSAVVCHWKRITVKPVVVPSRRPLIRQLEAFEHCQEAVSVRAAQSQLVGPGRSVTRQERRPATKAPVEKEVAHRPGIEPKPAHVADYLYLRRSRLSQ